MTDTILPNSYVMWYQCGFYQMPIKQVIIDWFFLILGKKIIIIFLSMFSSTVFKIKGHGQCASEHLTSVNINNILHIL